MPFLQAFVSACMLEAHELRSWWQEGTCVLCHFRYPSCSHLCCAWRSYYCVLSFLCSHTIHGAVIDDSQAFYLTIPLTSLLSHCLRECPSIAQFTFYRTDSQTGDAHGVGWQRHRPSDTIDNSAAAAEASSRS